MGEDTNHTHNDYMFLPLSAKLFFYISRLLVISGLCLSVLFLILIIRGDYPGWRESLTRIPGLKQLVAQRRAARLRAYNIELNMIAPSFDDILAFVTTPERFLLGVGQDRQRFARYIPYYQKVITYFPEIPEAYGLLGFCYYATGQYSRAVAFYQKAIALQPDYFGFYDQLGLIHLQHKNVVQARVLFQQALQTNLRKSVAIFHSFQLYRQMLWPKRAWNKTFVRKSMEERRKKIQKYLEKI